MRTSSYVRLVTDLMGDDPDKARKANQELLGHLVPKEKHADLVMVEIEARLNRQATLRRNGDPTNQ